MKKFLAITLVASMALGVVGCHQAVAQAHHQVRIQTLLL